MQIMCPKCAGSGKAKCLKCTEGYNYSVDSECLFCDGEGNITCPVCKGKGKVDST